MDAVKGHRQQFAQVGFGLCAFVVFGDVLLGAEVRELQVSPLLDLHRTNRDHAPRQRIAHFTFEGHLYEGGFIQRCLLEHLAVILGDTPHGLNTIGFYNTHDAIAHVRL